MLLKQGRWNKASNKASVQSWKKEVFSQKVYPACGPLKVYILGGW